MTTKNASRLSKCLWGAKLLLLRITALSDDVPAFLHQPPHSLTCCLLVISFIHVSLPPILMKTMTPTVHIPASEFSFWILDLGCLLHSGTTHPDSRRYLDFYRYITEFISSTAPNYYASFRPHLQTLGFYHHTLLI